MSGVLRAVRNKTRAVSLLRTFCSSSSPDGVSEKCPSYAQKFLEEKAKRSILYKPPIPEKVDILIIGGGIIGSSVAFWLKRILENCINIVVVEKDPTYQSCATTRSAGGIRQQFSLAENIQLSLFGAEFLRDYREYLGEDAPDPQYNPEGYLFLSSTDEGAALMEANAKLQSSLGARVQLLSPELLRAKFPFIQTDDVKLASYGRENEGWFDPWSLLQGMKKWNVQNEVGYVHGEVVDFVFKDVLGQLNEFQMVNEAIVKLPNGQLESIGFCNGVIAAGADSGHVGRLLKMGRGENVFSVPLPVEPRKRSIYSFHAPDAPIIGFPFLVDPSGAYVRREGLGGHFICGKSPDAEEENLADTDIEQTDDQYFTEKLWPILAQRVPDFQNIKPKHCWSGCYDYNYMDANAIVGAHPYWHNIYIGTGFSGHGLQMGPAVGRAIAELILLGRFRTIDLSRFSFHRVIHGEPIFEQGIV